MTLRHAARIFSAVASTQARREGGMVAYMPVPFPGEPHREAAPPPIFLTRRREPRSIFLLARGGDRGRCANHLPLQKTFYSRLGQRR